MSQQAARQAWFRAQAGVTSGSYTENIIQAYHALLSPVPNITVSEALMGLAKTATGAELGNLPGDLHAWSQLTLPTPTNWSSAGDLSTYTPTAVAFDGSTNSLRAGGPFGANTKLCAGFVEFTVDGLNAQIRNLQANGNTHVRLRLLADNAFEVFGRTGGAVMAAQLKSTSTYPVSAGTWRRLLFSWDTSDSGTFRLYDSDTDVLSITANLDAEVSWASSAINIATDSGELQRFQGCMSRMWIARGEYVDWAQESERRKVFDASGDAVDIGADGSGVTGSSPDLFWQGDIDRLLANDGSTADFTTQDGTFSECASPPTF